MYFSGYIFINIATMWKDISLITGFILFIFLILVIAERIWPLRKLTRPWVSRFLLNIALSIPMFLVAAFVVRPIGFQTMHHAERLSFGMLNWLHLSGWAALTIGFLLMDLSFYYWHWLNHNWPLLWRFHNAHHIDPDLDTSTAIRFHWMEVGYSSLFRLLQLSIIGVNPLTFIVYETVFQLNTLFHHSNVRLPIKFERILNKIIVTPRMHGIHHSQFKDELNSNFSVVFSWWDHLHRTLRLNIPQTSIVIGVPGYQQLQNNRFWPIMMMPFLSQRIYWPKEFKTRSPKPTLDKETSFLLE
jgi:sterol desaturase/sphingolipid hydroxylase (fatty acid hydroxylase superfamily)